MKRVRSGEATKRSHVRERLAASGSRGLGESAQVARNAAGDEATLRTLVEAASETNAVVAARAANALKKLLRAVPDASFAVRLAPFTQRLLQIARVTDSAAVLWNLFEVLCSLQLSRSQRAATLDLAFEALHADNAFLRAHALTAVVTLTDDTAAQKERLRRMLDAASEDSSAAVRARARRLLASTSQPRRSVH